MEDDLYLPVMEPTEVGQARRAVSELGRRLGFNETDVGRAAIVATELGTNLVKHAGGGELLARPLLNGTSPGLELLALDRGPGMADPEEWLRDGISSAGTAGEGLGAISRLSAFFDIYSRPGAGSVVLAEIWPGANHRGTGLAFDVGAVSVPKTGESVCGDAWSVVQDGRYLRLILADGLGHGPSAADAAREAIDTFSANADQPPVEMLRLVHAALKPTRGAAVAVASIDLEKGLLVYAGLGNIAGTIITPTAHRNLVSYNGTAGHEARKIQDFTYPWTRDSILLMHSDGLSTHWDLASYPGLADRRASLIAGQIYTDHTRRRDDVTVLVVRER